MCAAVGAQAVPGRLSGPLLDRVDLRVAMRPVKAMGDSGAEPESTAIVRERVLGPVERSAGAVGGHRLEHQCRGAGAGAAAAVPAAAGGDRTDRGSAGASRNGHSERSGPYSAVGVDGG